MLFELQAIKVSQIIIWCLIFEKKHKWIKAGNLNSRLSYLITTVLLARKPAKILSCLFCKICSAGSRQQTNGQRRSQSVFFRSSLNRQKVNKSAWFDAFSTDNWHVFSAISTLLFTNRYFLVLRARNYVSSRRWESQFALGFKLHSPKVFDKVRSKF